MASGYSLFSHCLFDKRKNKLDYYRDKNCMKNFSLDLSNKQIMNKQKLLLLQRKKEKHIEIKKFATYVKEHLVLMMKNIIKLRIIVIIQEDT